MLDRYCVTCHNERLKTAGLMLDKTDVGRIPDSAEIWEKVITKLGAGMMPPAGRPRPDAVTVKAFLTWLESDLDRAAAAKPNPGRAFVRRLNRAEYANAIRDLLDIDINVATLLPPDDSSYGFDNIADILGVSPSLQERYLSAAQKIAPLAIGDPTLVPVAEQFRADGILNETLQVDGLPFGTRGGMLVHYNFPVDGEYIIKPTLWRGASGIARGFETKQDVEILIDNERVRLETVGGISRNNGKPDGSEVASKAADDAEKFLATRVFVKAGPRNVGVTFPRKSVGEPIVKLRALAPIDTFEQAGELRIRTVTIEGPFNVTGPGDTPSRRRILVCRPAVAADEAPCANTILKALARRAYRRPVTSMDLQPLMQFYRMGRKDGDFERGIEAGLERLLADPEFVFRVEHNAPGAPGTIARVSDVELASRLSFFLWSSIPDEQLLAVATQGRLRNPGVLEQQVKRMLVDPRAKALTENFAGQWLYLRNVKQAAPNTEQFPDFDAELRDALLRETELFFDSIVREDHSVLDLMNADYTFVNERLARHYGIPNVYGSRFRRVTVTNEARRGLLGKGAILLVTSQPNRTSPVKRGKWILENLLDAPPPPPPPNVPPLKEQSGSDRPKSMREQMEEHRANPVCASCHKLMDPLGLAMETFDAVGTYRDVDHRANNAPIDAATELADGTKVNGPVELRRALMRDPERFVNTLTSKLMLYALGRGLEYYDAPTVRSIVRASREQDYRFSALVLGIVNSVPFQMRMTPQSESVGQAAHR
jgi:hypothetical protein